ncbi:sensor histidine kinase [Herminiimonas sp. NPDC097707]|uniref:sensor histidine kinase n=1 Tax=Herminiimonas sp. NPDC097707 TaxID=3364007 RepID=UPI00383B3E7E
MARFLDRIWIRFGLGIAATVLVTMGVMAITSYVYGQLEFERFRESLPDKVRVEFDLLNAHDMEDSPRAVEIYRQYWLGNRWDTDIFALFIDLLVCLPFGLIAGFWTSRMITQPVQSIAEAARRVAVGDFSVRADARNRGGEMTSLVNDFNHMTDALETLERERKSTMAAISHELRTPLAVLQARLHAICDNVIPANPKEFARLLDQVRHLTRLVDDLHTLSVADAGRLSLHRQDINLVALVNDVLSKYASRLAAHGIQAEMTVQGGIPHIQADEDRLHQILNNLIENALQYAESGGWLGIDLQYRNNDIVISVSDAGEGLSEDMHEQVFQRFQRLDPSRNRATGGSGLGLSIVRTLVELQGGQVSIDKSERGGARFIIRLPHD